MKELFSSLFGEQKLNRASLTHSGGEIAVVTRDVPKDGLVKGPNGPIYVELRCWESVGGFELRLSDYPLYLKAIAPYIR